MSDFSTRPMTRDDARAVNDLLAAAESVDHTEEHYSVEDVVEEIENPMIDLAHDWLLVERNGQVVGQTRLMPRAPDDGKVSLGIDGVVHPDHRRTGIGSHVVPLMIARAREYARERGLEPVITGSGPSAIADLESVFRKNGLQPERWSFVMEADLRAEGVGTEAPAVPEGYTLSTWVGVDQEEMRAAHNIAFVGHYGFTPWGVDMWRQWVSGSRNFRPELSLILRDGAGAVAAYIQTSEFDAVLEATGKRDAFVAKVGTTPEHRRKGLASLLLRIALHRYREAGFDLSSLDVDSENPTGALAIYERAGYRTTMRWTNYRLMD
ncbi:MAG: GNAT family N-acetyltransferase [Nocardioides sp.]